MSGKPPLRRSKRLLGHDVPSAVFEAVNPRVPAKKSKTEQNTCRVISIRYPNGDDKALSQEVRQIYSSIGITAETMTYFTQGNDFLEPILVPCGHGCNIWVISLLRVFDHIRFHHPDAITIEELRIQYWRFHPVAFACPLSCGENRLFRPEDVKKHMWRSHRINNYQGAQTGPKDPPTPPIRSQDDKIPETGPYTQCPYHCGVSEFENFKLAQTHVWVFHTSKPEEQEVVPTNDLWVAEE